MPKMDHDFFVDAVIKTVKDNLDYVPPYGKGSLYVRPIVMGISAALGVRPATKYRFIIYVSPCGLIF